MADPHIGQATWFHIHQFGNEGACGQTHEDSEFVVALAHGTFDTAPGADVTNPNGNPLCGKRLMATYQNKSVVLKVVDRCADCEQAANIDLSPTAFKILAPLEVGRLSGVQWDWTELPAGDPAATTPAPAPETEQAPAPAPRGVVVERRLLKARLPSVNHPEHISRNEGGADAEIESRSSIDVGNSPRDAEATVTDRTKRAITPDVGKPFKRRFNMADPIRLRRFYDAIQERDAMNQGVKASKY